MCKIVHLSDIHWRGISRHEEYTDSFTRLFKILREEIKPDLSPAKEAVKILAAIPKGSRVIALDERGKDQTTQNLATELANWRQEGFDITFLIGGADGLDADLKKNAQAVWRLSSLTMPHAMARVLLVEQLYRAWTILQGHPYHRE